MAFINNTVSTPDTVVEGAKKVTKKKKLSDKMSIEKWVHARNQSEGKGKLGEAMKVANKVKIHGKGNPKVKGPK